jgi:hypothetical protein
MRFKLAVLFSLLLAQVATAEDATHPTPGSVAYLDWRYGFRDLKFEQSVESSRDMVLIEDDGDLKFYTRKNDSLELGGAKLKLIEYGYYKGKFATVMITADGEADAVALLKSLETDYGPGSKSPRNISKFYWFGDRVLADYMTSAKGWASVGMWSKPLQALQQTGRETKAKELIPGS